MNYGIVVRRALRLLMKSNKSDREPAKTGAGLDAKTTCRLCGGLARAKWSAIVLGKHDVSYYECANCGSLQTDEPHWLEEAYAVRGAGLDTGAVQRSIGLALSVHAILDLVGFDKNQAGLDFGAGVGLYARMMRDFGYNYWASDAYNSLYFIDRFVGDRPRWSLISAFEVAEHLPHPKQTWAELFAKRPDYLFFSTDVYSGQDQSWHYLAFDEGQHVFFYSLKALQQLADSHGYYFTDLGRVKIFSRSRSPLPTLAQIEKHALRLLIRHRRDPWKYADRDNRLLTSGNGQ